LDTNLRLQLSPEEEQSLFQKYDLKRDGSICYREFCDVINRSELLGRMKISRHNELQFEVKLSARLPERCIRRASTDTDQRKRKKY